MLDFHLHNPANWLDSLLRQTSFNLAIRENIRNVYGGHDRAYHGTFHIAFLWYAHIHLRNIDGAPSALYDYPIANAIASHDYIYDAKFTENELASARWWRTHGAGSDKFHLVYDAIKATKNHFDERPMETPDDYVREWFVGLDLIPLAAPWNIFQRNQLMIRAEYFHLSKKEWKMGRNAFLTKLCETDVIYRHPVLRQMFEQNAKRNAKQSLKEG